MKNLFAKSLLNLLKDIGINDSKPIELNQIKRMLKLKFD